MSNIVKYKKHYEIFIKWQENPIKISWEWWEAIIKDLIQNSSWFILINWTLYNRFSIDKIEPYEEKLSEAHLEAIAFKKQIEEKKKELWI